MKKQIGKNTLGSGNKMEVDLKTYNRSTHDLGYTWRSSMAAGTLVPFMSKIALPGDTWDIKLDADVMTHPTEGPLFGSYKVQLDVFCAPIRLYTPLIQNNVLEIGLDMAKVVLPKLVLLAAAKEQEEQINPSCIFSYLGIRGIGKPETTSEDGIVERRFNAVPWLTYLDIYKNYYANKQEEQGAIIHKEVIANYSDVSSIRWYKSDGTWVLVQKYPSIADDKTLVKKGNTLQINFDQINPTQESIVLFTAEGEYLVEDIFAGGWIEDNTTSWMSGEAMFDIEIINWAINGEAGTPIDKPRVTRFQLKDIDNMRRSLLTSALTGQPVIYENINTAAIPVLNYALQYNGLTGTSAAQQTQEGLLLKTYQNDLFQNWMRTEWIDGENGINAVTAVSTEGDSFTIDQLNISKKVYDMLNRIAISGGSYYDWLETVYTTEQFKMVQTPMYMGGLSKELVFQEVVSSGYSTSPQGGQQPLGTLAGRGVMAKKHKGGDIVIKVNEPSYILGIISLTPRIDYSQGNDWDVNLDTLDDIHKPALDEIGYQDLITDQMAWFDTKVQERDGVEYKEPVFKSAGKQPAWINYMTSVNQTRGNFALPNNEMFMTLNRRYERGINGIKDLTTYIDPSKFNFIFAETRLDAQNFWTQVRVDAEVRRVMSAKLMPNL